MPHYSFVTYPTMLGVAQRTGCGNVNATPTNKENNMDIEKSIIAIIRSLQAQYADARGQAETASTDWTGTEEQIYHQGYSNGRAAALDAAITNLELLLTLKAAK